MKAASSMIGTPAASALVTLLAPGLSPATRAKVLALTLPGLVPPRATTSAAASSLDHPASVPVTTTALPARTCGPTSTGSGTTPKSTPAARSRSTNARLLSRPNQAAIDRAMIGPSPATPPSSSSDAAMIASSVPKWAASACAAAGPRCLIPRAVSRRGSGRWRDASMAPSSFSALIAANPSSVSSCSAVRPYRSAASLTSPVAVSWPTVRSPRPSMSMAPREAK